jgi:hypothetical protein
VERLTGERTSAARSTALEVDGGLLRWSSRLGKLQMMIPMKRQNDGEVAVSEAS